VKPENVMVTRDGRVKILDFLNLNMTFPSNVLNTRMLANYSGRAWTRNDVRRSDGACTASVRASSADVNEGNRQASRRLPRDIERGPGERNRDAGVFHQCPDIVASVSQSAA
jgi:hypothetical protein